MSKIFGIDLGTNSIGWALRNPELTENQIEKFGVLTFNKGVGLGKTGEYSYAAERTKKRSARRLYQARKYRLWATLENLIQEGYCPLTIEDLNKWRHYNKEEAHKNNNGGRIYPIWNTAFDAWIKLDFNNDGKPDYSSPYQLRKELAETKLDFNQEINRFKLGRALYHIAQRRGFKSSRKGADDVKEKETNDNDEVLNLQYSEKKKNKTIAELFERYTDAKTIGWLFALLETDKVRVREAIAQYAIRENYKDEIKYIFQERQELGFEHPLYTKLVETGKNKNNGSIFYKRP
ncbi:type II CRISPR RNA-guided endonuclease Cas9, partial [Pedobacter sp. UBA4863]